MVDSIGSTPTSSVDRPVAPVQRAAATAPAQPVATQPKSSVPTLAATAKVLASSPPVDAARVAQIKKAIATGTFPILPATIADRLLALKLDWISNDEA